MYHVLRSALGSFSPSLNYHFLTSSAFWMLIRYTTLCLLFLIDPFILKVDHVVKVCAKFE